MYYAQFMEDALIDGLFKKIGTTNQLCLDIGANNGVFCSNTRFFMEKGWDGLFVEPDDAAFRELEKLYPGKCVKQAVTSENTIDIICEGNNLPLSFDLMNLDIDGQEYYVWGDMKRYRPRIVVVEWSPYVNWDFIPKRDSFGDDGRNQAGLHPMLALTLEKDYVVVAVTPVNLICMDKSLCRERLVYWEGHFPL